MKTLTKKVVLVTGAGSGIGKAIAELFAREGASVVLADIDSQNIEAVVAEIEEKEGIASCFTADIAKEDDVAQLFDYVLRTYHRLDILVNNAGVMDNFTPVAETTSDLWSQVIDVNLNGPFYTCRKAVNIFLEQSEGVIVNIASVAGLNGGRAGAAYTTSKHGLVGLTKNIGYDYAQKGIRCNAIAPGGVNTNIIQGITPNAFGFDRMNAGTTNNPKTAEPSEVAEVALFLASDRSAFINGSILVADGGWTAY